MQQKAEGLSMSPSMPDVVRAKPSSIWKAGDYILILLENPKPISARFIGEAAASGLRYDATLAVIDRKIGAPCMYITLETSIAGTFLCRFAEADLHENLGPVEDMDLETFVTTTALDMFRKKFDFTGTIEKVDSSQLAAGSRA
jgi:hypothetical protein